MRLPESGVDTSSSIIGVASVAGGIYSTLGTDEKGAIRSVESGRVKRAAGWQEFSKWRSMQLSPCSYVFLHLPLIHYDVIIVFL